MIGREDIGLLLINYGADILLTDANGWNVYCNYYNDIIMIIIIMIVIVIIII